MFTVFKSFQKSQTHYQKEERFTVQNKMTNAGPHQRKYSKSTAFCLIQSLVCHEERSTLQNKKTRLEMETSGMGPECTVLESIS